MFFSIVNFFSLALFLSLSFCRTTQGDERRYECGPHGRFEYCIDGIPGCVVGCHCHPGYYFDTDSKICESNANLQQEFRRNYRSEISHMHTPANTPIATDSIPTPTPKTKTELDEKVDEIAKDTDDIGDWLYNQFFKTIENQVINKTNEKPSKLTRRSGGSGPPPRKTKRKSRKSSKDGKKKIGKVHGLRRKLLRITEDDSLFDSSSSAETSDDSSTSSESTDSSSDTSSSSDKDEHGHSTILMYNKKPKPPLPSFIFLPHMGTPFFPPIGLPPPPVLPMYPMVPIPPMAPMFPYPGPNSKDDNDTNNAGVSTPAADSPATTPTPETSDKAISDVIPNIPNEPKGSEVSDTPINITPPASLRTRYNIRQGKKSRKGNHPKEPNTENMFRTKNNKGSRNKLMQKLRDNMKNKMPVINQYDNDQEEDSPLMNDLSSQETFSLSKKVHLRAMEEEFPNMKDVDFKYLSELIHRANINDTRKMRPHHIAPNENRRDMTSTGQVGRRSYQNEPVQEYTQPINNLQEPRNLQTSGADNAFYSNLGRQIASMIRNIDSKGERQVNIEIERSNPTIPHTMLDENRYAPRSYWERSVRSPLRYFKEEYANPINDKLFSLEKEVENAASTSPSLSLHDLEDILSKMSKAQIQIQRKVMFEEHKPNKNINNTSLNINLLPMHEISKDEKKMFYETPNHSEHRGNRDTPNPSDHRGNRDTPNPNEHRGYWETPNPSERRGNASHPKANVENITVSSDTVNKSKYTQQDIPADFWWLDMVKPIPVRQPELNRSITILKPVYDIKPTRRSLIDDISTTVETIQAVPRRKHVDYLTFIQSLSHRQQQPTTTILPNLSYHTRVLNYLSYFPGTKNDYRHNQRPIAYPQQISSFSRSVNTPIQKPMRRPSYFHHELHHFDYFE